MSDSTLADRLAELTLELIRIPSVTGDEAAIADHVQTYMERIWDPASVHRCGHSVVAARPVDDRPAIALYGHLDTVPGREDGPPRRDDEFVYGTGASDMKGALAVMLALAEDIDPDTLPVRVEYVFYDREEGPYVDNGLEPLFAERGSLLSQAELAICMEPTDNDVQAGCVGTLHATARFEGKRSHSARPWEGKNAIHAAGPLLSKLRDLAPRRVELDGLLFQEVLSATVARSPTARNVIPDHFELNLNYRFAPGKTVEQARADVETIVGAEASIEFTDLCPSGSPGLANPHLQRLLERVEGGLLAKQAWTDVARLELFGVPAVNYGPGAGAQAHQRNERAPIAPMATAYHELLDFLRSDPTH